MVQITVQYLDIFFLLLTDSNYFYYKHVLECGPWSLTHIILLVSWTLEAQGKCTVSYCQLNPVSSFFNHSASSFVLFLDRYFLNLCIQIILWSQVETGSQRLSREITLKIIVCLKNVQQKVYTTMHSHLVSWGDFTVASLFV